MDLTEIQLTLAELYEITTTDGSIARFTSHDADITYDGNPYQAIPIQRGPISYHVDLQVDKVDISFGLVGIKVGTKEYTIPQVIRRDFLRNAHVKIYLIDYIQPTEIKLLFEGYVTGDITFDQGRITISAGSVLDRLRDKFPKLVYSEFCNHKLFSSYCGLSKEAYKATGTVGAGSTQQFIYSSVFLFTNKPQGWWVKGEIKMTSGNNINLSKMIVSHGDGYIKVMFPFSETMALGDTFEAYPGCDKSGETCATKFTNYANFLGFEYIPKPETLYP